MLGALLALNLAPVPLFISRNADLFWGLMASMHIGNVMLLVLNLPLVGLFVRILLIARWVLVPTVVLAVVLGPMMEVNLRRALSLSNGDWGVLYGSPITIALWVMVVVSLFLPLVMRRRKPAKVTVVQETEPKG